MHALSVKLRIQSPSAEAESCNELNSTLAKQWLTSCGLFQASGSVRCPFNLAAPATTTLWREMCLSRHSWGMLIRSKSLSHGMDGNSALLSGSHHEVVRSFSQ